MRQHLISTVNMDTLKQLPGGNSEWRKNLGRASRMGRFFCVRQIFALSWHVGGWNCKIIVLCCWYSSDISWNRQLFSEQMRVDLSFWAFTCHSERWPVILSEAKNLYDNIRRKCFARSKRAKHIDSIGVCGCWGDNRAWNEQGMPGKGEVYPT